MRGSYILLIELSEAQTIFAGRLKTVSFPRGYYAYVGSAMGGIWSRLGRHLGTNKKIHWHIDYLLEKAKVDEAIICESENKAECAIAQALGAQFDTIPGFGCSDCKCHSHLFLADEEMNSKIMAMLDSMGIRCRLLGFDQIDT